MSKLEYIFEIKPVESNILLFKVKSSISTLDLFNHLRSKNILIILMDKEWMRIVTHLDIKEKDVQVLFEALSTFS